MSSKLVPKNPEEVMVIREIVPGVTTLSVPFLRGGLIKFGGRATISMSHPFHPILYHLSIFLSTYLQHNLTNLLNSKTNLRHPRRLLPRRPDPHRPKNYLDPLNLPNPSLLPHRARSRAPHLPLRLVIRVPHGTHNRPRRASRETRQSERHGQERDAVRFRHDLHQGEERRCGERRRCERQRGVRSRVRGRVCRCASEQGTRVLP